MSMKKSERKRYKIVKFTFDEVDTIEARLNAVADLIREQGGSIITTLNPVTFGYKPVMLIYTICYKAAEEIAIGGTEDEESEPNGDNSTHAE